MDPELRLAHRRHRAGAGAAAAAVALLLLVWTSTSPALGAWTRGVVTNQTNGARTGTLAFTVTGSSGGACAQAAGVTSTLAAPQACPGSLVGSGSVSNAGTTAAAGISATVRGESCGTVQLADRIAPSAPMVPRRSVQFRQTGPYGAGSAITLGTSPSGPAYAASVQSQTSTSVNGGRYGYGIWFRAASGQGGTLFSFDASPTDTATSGQDDRTLSLGTDGRLTFTALRGLNLLQPAPATTTASYADGSWHFAYVTMVVSGLTLTTTVFVDGQQAAQQQALNAVVVQYVTTTGYWHVGWGAVSTPAYFTGSLSNFVVFAGGNAPAVPASNPANQTAMNTFATGATDHWVLDDTGTTTWTGTQPVIGTTSPCALTLLTWTFASPAATAFTSLPASTVAAGTAYAVAAVPGPGAPQTSTLSVARASGADAYVAGLRLLVPLTYRVVAGAAGSGWTQTFRFASADSAVVVP
ncbi:hypothetical protein [Nocardioides flavescens]|uniref:Concanavalin A-like lectin/glucanases superfamily protein n=1 Tax=Nocardioides flavescens TaxID=2691959 RepID=A0A6L7EVC8_9ACTN|nr:hypothetical protein [Nocardioides flavescens]MXG90670.1 hypothetical protein [Nocardioides flavescens]